MGIKDLWYAGDIAQAASNDPSFLAKYQEARRTRAAIEKANKQMQKDMKKRK